MKLSPVLMTLAAVAMVPQAALAQDKPAPEKTETGKKTRDYIPFANSSGVWDWQSEGDEIVYFQDSHKRWFKAELMRPALDLPFVNHIGIDAGATGRLDKFGAIYVRGQRYVFKSFAQVDGPPKKKDKKSKD